MVVVLAGGTGGAKLARGMQDVVGARELVVVVNTADDSEHHGVHVSPDPDLVAYWLADVIDERGWGIAGDTWTEMERRRSAGEDTWFNLGDRDLGWCRLRTERLAAGDSLTAAHAAVVRGLGVGARVLPMSDEPVATWVRVGGAWRPFQEFMILERGRSPEAVELRGVERARPTRAVLEALAGADAIVIGPSNPVISIGPILAVPGMREAIAAARAPVVAVSPFVSGRAVKGPTEDFCRMAGLPLGAAAVVRAYAGLVDGVVSDEPAPAGTVDPPEPPPRATDAGPASHPAWLRTETLMDTPDRRRRVAAASLELAHALAARG